MDNLPKISIITPSFNQVKFLEQTIKSILNQEYKNYEYIIMDGGSSDGSLEIIKKYADKLAYFESKPDKGQADAIYRGFQIASGEILCWVNSDDLLLPGALMKVAKWFKENPDKNWVTGGTIIIDENGLIFRDKRGAPLFNMGAKVGKIELLYFGHPFNQPASFWRKDFFLKVNGFDRQLNFCFDYDLFLKFAMIERSGRIKDLLAKFRYHADSKSSTLREIRNKENQLLWKKYKRKKYLVPFLSNYFLIKYYLRKIKLMILFKTGIVDLNKYIVE